jgi:hypothetical protein
MPRSSLACKGLVSVVHARWQRERHALLRQCREKRKQAFTESERGLMKEFHGLMLLVAIPNHGKAGEELTFCKA